MPGKYKAESDSKILTNPADNTSLDFIFSLPPGFYPSINIFAYIDNARGGMQCFMRNPLTNKYKFYFPPQFSKWSYDRLNWEISNIQIEVDNDIYIQMAHTKAGDVILWGYHATREV